jgi:hypothetical protein
LLTEQSERLLALLGLSLEGPDLPSAEWLSRLGAFHGGALESALTAICEFDEQRWWSLRQELERIGLIMVERLSGVVDPFLRFHPTLVTAVQAKPSVGDHRQLTKRHLAVYWAIQRAVCRRYQLSEPTSPATARTSSSSTAWSDGGRAIRDPRAFCRRNRLPPLAGMECTTQSRQQVGQLPPRDRPRCRGLLGVQIRQLAG